MALRHAAICCWISSAAVKDDLSVWSWALRCDGSCMEWDLVDKVVGWLLQFGSSPKTAPLQGQFDKAHCCGAGPNFLAYRWLFFSHEMASCIHLENFSIKSGIYYVLYCVTFGCILLFLDITVQPLKSFSCDFWWILNLTYRLCTADFKEVCLCEPHWREHQFLLLRLIVCKRMWFLRFIGTWKLSRAMVMPFCCAANASTVTQANLDTTYSTGSV